MSDISNYSGILNEDLKGTVVDKISNKKIYDKQREDTIIKAFEEVNEVLVKHDLTIKEAYILALGIAESLYSIWMFGEKVEN